MHEAKNHSCVNITLLNNSRTAWPRNFLQMDSFLKLFHMKQNSSQNRDMGFWTVN